MTHTRFSESGTVEALEIIHLPVATQLVTMTRFSPPPGSRDNCLGVAEALDYLGERLEENRAGRVMAALTGPGDPLATPETTLAVLEGIRNNFAVPAGLSTCGIGSGGLAGELASAGLHYVEMRIEAVRSEIIEKIFAWIRPGNRTVKLADAAPLLLKEQRQGISTLRFHSIEVVVATTLFPGYNLDHIAKIGAETVELGANAIALTPYRALPGAEVILDTPNEEEINLARERASKYLPVAASLLQPAGEQNESVSGSAAFLPAKPSPERPNVAVVSAGGMDVDLHLGQAIRFLIYGPREDGLACLLETREAPEPGSGNERWRRVSDILGDCFILLAASAGKTPRQQLAENGLPVYICEDNIEGIVDMLYGGGKKKRKRG